MIDSSIVTALAASPRLTAAKASAIPARGGHADQRRRADRDCGGTGAQYGSCGVFSGAACARVNLLDCDFRGYFHRRGAVLWIVSGNESLEAAAGALPAA